MLGCLFVFNQYAYDSAATLIANHVDMGDIEDIDDENATTWGGLHNAGSWLLSTSALGLLAQLTFFMPRVAALHKVQPLSPPLPHFGRPIGALTNCCADFGRLD